MFESMQEAEFYRDLFQTECAAMIAEHEFDLNWQHRGYMSDYLDLETARAFQGFVTGIRAVRSQMGEPVMVKGEPLYRMPSQFVCPDCHNTKQVDSGGVQPWGEAVYLDCPCASRLTPAIRHLLSQVLPLLSGHTPHELKDQIAALVLPPREDLDAELLALVRAEEPRKRVGWLVPAIKRCRELTAEDLRTCRLYVLNLLARHNINPER